MSAMPTGWPESRSVGRGGPVAGGTGIGGTTWTVRRIVKLVTAYFWAAGMMLAGLWMLRRSAYATTVVEVVVGLGRLEAYRLTRAWGMCSVAGALFGYMFFVADDLCPRAPMVLTGTLKLAAGLVMWLTLAWSVYLIVNGRS
ncbi:MAG: hypothetical protein GC164_00350 [Phycisphaera sp.]|nr:hypothetical protein [Phycisphaera sp.]